MKTQRHLSLYTLPFFWWLCTWVCIHCQTFHYPFPLTLRGHCFSNFLSAGEFPWVFQYTIIVLSFKKSLSGSHGSPATIPFLCFAFYQNCLKEFLYPPSLINSFPFSLVLTPTRLPPLSFCWTVLVKIQNDLVPQSSPSRGSGIVSLSLLLEILSKLGLGRSSFRVLDSQILQTDPIFT